VSPASVAEDATLAFVNNSSVDEGDRPPA
jgi:hypothetical protein